MIQLATNVLGTFAVKEGKIIKKIFFPEEPQKVAQRLESVRTSVCDEEIQLIKELIKSGIKEIEVDNPRRFRGKKLNIDFLQSKKTTNVFDIASEVGVSKEKVEDLILRVNQELTKSKLKEPETDQLIIQAVCTIDDFDEVINMMVERLREWYSLHFPELDHEVKNHEVYVKLVNSLGHRKNFRAENMDIEPKFAKRIEEAQKNSYGSDFSDSDIEGIKKLSSPILELYESKSKVELYLNELMEKNAPNISALAGPILGARLISLAGSLKRLSILPAGTIQILGAEDAFFRFLSTKKRPPKHGIIFQLPEIRGAPKKIRGKISRMFAAKLAIAAKIDAFHGNFIGDKLRQDFLEKVKNLNKA